MNGLNGILVFHGNKIFLFLKYKKTVQNLSYGAFNTC